MYVSPPKICMSPINCCSKRRGDSLHPLRETEGLYPLQALVQPVALRFRYHFDSERETNRLDKVGWLCCPYEYFRVFKLIFSPSGILHILPMLPMTTGHSWKVSYKDSSPAPSFRTSMRGYVIPFDLPSQRYRNIRSTIIRLSSFLYLSENSSVRFPCC